MVSLLITKDFCVSAEVSSSARTLLVTPLRSYNILLAAMEFIIHQLRILTTKRHLIQRKHVFLAAPWSKVML